jgi:hypothetical protein
MANLALSSTTFNKMVKQIKSTAITENVINFEMRCSLYVFIISACLLERRRLRTFKAYTFLPFRSIIRCKIIDPDTHKTLLKISTRREKRSTLPSKFMNIVYFPNGNSITVWDLCIPDTHDIWLPEKKWLDLEWMRLFKEFQHVHRIDTILCALAYRILYVSYIKKRIWFIN